MTHWATTSIHKNPLNAQVQRHQAEVDRTNAKRSQYQTKLNRIADERSRLSDHPYFYRDRLRKLDGEESQLKSLDNLAYMQADDLYQSIMDGQLSNR